MPLRRKPDICAGIFTICMTNLILFDDPAICTALLPFTFTRPVAKCRVGILTIAEKWEKRLEIKASYLTQDYLRTAFPQVTGADNLYVNGAILPTDALTDAVRQLAIGQSLVSSGGQLLAMRTTETVSEVPVVAGETVVFADTVDVLKALPSFLDHNGRQIRVDFALLTAGRQSQPVTDPFTHCYGAENIFIEEGATIRASILNAENGPIYIGRDARINEGSVVIGPFALGENSIVQWTSKMRANTSVGPNCKIGGEVGNSILFAYSAKQHDGYLGDSVIGEWCNLGADTNNSNLKNDYGNVKLHSYATGKLEDSGRMFCGLMMGDFTRAGISTMFNTGTVVGVSVNVFGGGFQPKHIPSFSWGGAADGFVEYRPDKALHVAGEAYKRRNLVLGEVEEQVLRAIFDKTRPDFAPS